MTTIFSQIIDGKIPAHKILENDKFLAFLDIRPIAPGHTLVIPKEETDYFFDLDTDLMSGIMPFAQIVAKALKKSIDCVRVGVIVAGLEVPHAHVHLVPFNSMSELSFDHAKAASPEELSSVQSKILATL